MHAPGQEFTRGRMPRGKSLPGGACPGARVYQGGHAMGHEILPGGALPRGKDFYQGGALPPMPPPWRRPWLYIVSQAIVHSWQRGMAVMVLLFEERSAEHERIQGRKAACVREWSLAKRPRRKVSFNTNSNYETWM